MNRTGFLAGCGALAAVPRIVDADVPSVGDAIARLFTAPSIDAEWLSPSLVAVVPVDELRSMIAGIVQQLGSYRSIVPDGSTYALTFERGRLHASAALDAKGAFTALFFSGMQCASVSERLGALFTVTTIPADWSTPYFLASIPIERVRTLVGTLKSSYGAFVADRPQPDGTYAISFAKSTVIASAVVDGAGRFAGLILRPSGKPPEDD